MSSLRKETDAEKAFREASEHVESVLATMHSACLPEGTDYHVGITSHSCARDEPGHVSWSER